MNRLTKKCLLGSFLLHGLLCVILVVASAFKSSEHGESLPPVITMLQAELTDGASHGGNREASAPSAPQAAPPQPVAPQPTPPPVQPEPPKPQPPAPAPEPPKVKVSVPEPEPPKPAPPEKIDLKPIIPKFESKKPEKKVEKIDKSDFTPVTPTKAPTKTATKPTKLDLKPVAKNTAVDAQKVAQARAAAASQAAAAAQQAQALRDALGALDSAQHNIQKNGAGRTMIDAVGGVGGDGPAAVNYGQFVKAMYDDAWMDPDDVSDENAVVKTEITIKRNGSVASARILSRSGIPALDKSVQRALDRIDFIRPFPAGSTDQQRTYILKFNLKAKRSLG